MIKEVLLKALDQKKGRETFFAIWSWIYAKSNDQNVYYGTMKEICEGCLVDYQKLNKAFELQYQWNKPNFEKTIILRKDDAYFKSFHNHHLAEKYLEVLNIEVKQLRSLYRPIIIVFNDKPMEILENQAMLRGPLIMNPEEQSLAFSEKKLNGNHKLNVHDKKINKLPVIIIPEKLKKEIEKQLINACLDIYISFYKREFDCEPPQLSDKKEAGAEINALKNMIKYFRKINKDTDKSDSAIVNSFSIIFQNWHKYSEYYQKQLKLRQISSNLVNIIAYIKQNPTQINKSKTEKVFAFEKNIQTIIDSGALDSRIEKLGKPMHSK